MRMRHKKHLDERLGNVTNLIDVRLTELNSQKSMLHPKYLNFSEIFGNDNPVILEIGCGFGSFARQFGAKHPDLNLIAMEKDADVIVGACEKSLDLPNVKYMKICARYLLTFFRDNSVDAIYLNFSPPYPKESYASSRLTHSSFLSLYARVLKRNGLIHIKTDNDRLFEFTLQQLNENNWEITGLSRDLHQSIYRSENIITEYERKFLDKGQTIKYVEAFYKK